MSRRQPNPGADRAAQNLQTIKSLLKLEGNKGCADCKRNKHPRWASWNLGVFVCIRCSGIHRGMGTHISRIKSVDLDSWTDEQLQGVLRWGNARANKYWEAKLAPGHVPSEAKIENFIRTKYESKRWVMDGLMPDPSTLDAEGDDDMPLNIVQEKAKMEMSSSQRNSSAPSQSIAPPPKRAQQSFDLIGGDDVPSPPIRPSTTDAPSARPPPPKVAAPSQLLGGLDFFDTPPERPASASSKPAGSSGPSRPDLKQSILSLYATAPRSQSQPQPQPQPQQQNTSPPQPQHGRQSSFGGMQAPSGGQNSAFGGLDDAFSSLNFNTTSSTASPPKQQARTSPFASFGQTTRQKSTPAAAQITSTPLSGGTFFDTVPKPPPKSVASKPPPPALRKISNASDGFGEFSTAMNPATASSAATSSNGLLDLSSPPSVSSARPAQPSTVSSNVGSVFNLSKPAPPSSYAPVIQSSAPPTQSTFSGLPAADAWSTSDPWSTPDGPAVATPRTASVKSPAAASSATQSDFGWGNTPAPSAGLGNVGNGGFGITSVPDDGGFGVQSPPAPKIAVEEDFGGWNSAAPETPAVPTLAQPRNATQQIQPSFAAPPSEDLWSNVWQ